MFPKSKAESDLRIIAKDKICSLGSAPEVKAFTDLAFKTDQGGLVIVGWVFDPGRRVTGFSVIQKHTRGLLKRTRYVEWPIAEGGGGVSALRVRRGDVSAALLGDEGASEEKFGLVMVFAEFPEAGQLALALADGRLVRLPFVVQDAADQIEQALTRVRPHSGKALQQALEAALGPGDRCARWVGALAAGDGPAGRHILPFRAAQRPQQIGPVKYYLEAAYALSSGVILIGWLTDRQDEETRLCVWERGGRQIQAAFRDAANGLRLFRTFRPDLKAALSAERFGDGQHGFVLYWPLEKHLSETISVGFDADPGSKQKLRLLPADADAYQTLMPLWIHCGGPLKQISSELEREPGLRALLRQVDMRLDETGGPPFAACDEAILFNNQVMILSGWVSRHSDDLGRVEIVTRRGRRDISAHIVRYAGGDLPQDGQHAGTGPVGFFAVLAEPSVLSCSIQVEIHLADGQSQLTQPTVQAVGWSALGAFMRRHTALTEPLLEALSHRPALEPGPGQLEKHLAALRRQCFQARYQHLPSLVDDDRLIGAVDMGVALGKAGLLLMGWRLLFDHRPVAVSVHGPEGRTRDLSGQLYDLVRLDVVQSYQSRLADANEWCGFICLAPLPTYPGEFRALRFDFGDGGEAWLKIPTETPHATPRYLAKEILGAIPAPDRIKHKLYQIFDGALGPAIEAINASRAPLRRDLEEIQFGEPPQAVDLSIIVPLYGRCDFVRHQLAAFADDPDLLSVDLVYVVDDPSIIDETIQLAATYYPLFEIPFRVVWSGRNHGFAGANNLGAGVARGAVLLLMNSDVIPQEGGWLGALRAALDTLPGAGAVSPLLQYADGAIQHAGMVPHRDPQLPGFVLNKHTGMGTAYDGGERPSEHPMLTAACLMLRKGDYEALGGMDEGYLVGDFEDSDLCLALRQRGQRLWLVPAVRLWHLERQSQNLAQTMDQRQMLTLYNGWRYGRKLGRGAIAAPTEGEV